jgi:acyl-CoA synthetase (AMP-forming)/AMP-acid ligase II
VAGGAEPGGAEPGAALPWRSVPALVAWAARFFSAREALVDADVRMSFAELGDRVAEAARAFVAAGVAPGDRVAVWAPNSWAWAVAALGAVSAGGALVPVNTRFKGREAAFVVARSGARALVTVREFLGVDYPAMLREAAGGPADGRPVAGLPRLERIVIVPGPGAAPSDAAPSEATLAWETFLAGAARVPEEEAAARAAAVGPEDLSDVIFTSGTTGEPKGVMATHGQTLRVFETWSRLVGLREGDRYLIVNPFFHTFGYKAGILACLMRGATMIPEAVFDAGRVLRRIEAERVSVLPGPPTLYQSLLAHPDRQHADLSSLRLAVTGAAVVPVALVRAMREELGFRVVLTAYGLTESTGTATMCRPEDDLETIATTSGRAIEGTEVRVVDEAGRPLPPGQPGEVVIRGYNVMRGYFEDPKRTAEVIDRDGWLHTGDVGVMDARGYLRITDRKKDIFIVGGFNVSPAEVENELLAHPAVVQAAVVGAPDERLGEVGVAFVVPRPGARLDPEELVAWARERMANYKAPRRVEVVDQLPLNASGKVLKHVLRERAAARLAEHRREGPREERWAST